MAWMCDRCGSTIEVPEQFIICEDFSPKALRHEPDEWRTLSGWAEFADNESVIDVCPGCITDSERADLLFSEAEVNVALGEEP
jgi:hypothetical protein